MRGFFTRLFSRSNPMPASAALMHHVEGTGTGWEVDDLMSWSPTPEQEEKAIRPLLDIHERYRSAEYPIGTSNPASFDEIRSLAERYASKVSSVCFGSKADISLMSGLDGKRTCRVIKGTT